MLVSHKGRPLPVDAQDALWLARAVEAEGAPRGYVAQTLVNRWAWLLDRGNSPYPRLQDLVRAYSQPVNPRWMEGGDLFEAELAELDDDAQRAAAVERARGRREHAARTVFSPNTKAAVDLALHGPIVIPPGAVDFGPVKGGRWAARMLRAGDARTNAIYSAPGSDGVSYAFESGPDFAPFPMSRALATTSPVGGLVVAGFGLLAAWAVARRARAR